MLIIRNNIRKDINFKKNILKTIELIISEEEVFINILDGII